jgi:hypothetical protein
MMFPAPRKSENVIKPRASTSAVFNLSIKPPYKKSK